MLLKLVGWAFLGLVVLVGTAWASCALYYSNLPWSWLRTAAAALYPAAVAAAFLRWRRSRALLAFFGSAAAMLVWWNLIPATNDRDWSPELAKLATATIDGDQITIRNIRNCDYRSATDFTPRYYDKTVKLSELDSVDLIAMHWAGDTIAHIMVSFGFGGKDYLCFSIERRHESDQAFSTWKGFFHQYELIYIVGDERDVIRSGTNFRGDRVYLYRTRIPLENQRALFLDYLRKLNSLAERPEWYNTLTDNCTTGVLLHTRAYNGIARYNWKVLLSGYLAEYVYDLDGLDTSMPFEDLKRISLITERAVAAGDAPDFSQRIRAEIPMPRPWTMEEFLEKR